MEESKKKLKSFLMKVKEESERADLKHNIQKNKIVTSSPIISCPIDGGGGEAETVADFIFLGSKITVKLKDTWSLEEKLWQT